jgi:hypothetical protein
MCSGILELSMGDRNRVGIGLSYRRSAGYIGGVDFLKSIPGLLKSLCFTSLIIWNLASVGFLLLVNLNIDCI